MDDIAPLPEHSDIDRVITEDDARIMSLKATVMHMDELYAFSNRGWEVLFTNPVPIVDRTSWGEGEPRTLGYATLAREDMMFGDVISAEIFLAYDTPERLDIQTKSRKLYPFLEGVANYTLKTFEVQELVINSDEPDDPRIDPL